LQARAVATIRTRADLSSLPAIRDYVLEAAAQANITGEVPPKLDLVLEEVIVNVANHAYDHQGGEVEVECSVRQSPDSDSPSFCLQVRDWGPPFDPLKADMPDTTIGIDERPIGGLGLLLVISLANDCTYTRQDDMNILTLCFNV